MRIEFAAAQSALLDTVPVSAQGTPAEVRMQVASVAEGVWALVKDLVALRNEVIKLIRAPPTTDAVE